MMNQLKCLLICGLALCLFVGCTQGPTQTKIDPLAGASGDLDKIKDALKKAGVTKEIAAVNDLGDNWRVTLQLDGIGPNGEPPPGRPLPTLVMVEKSSMKVTVLNEGGKGRSGGVSQTVDPDKPAEPPTKN